VEGFAAREGERHGGRVFVIAGLEDGALLFHRLSIGKGRGCEFQVAPIGSTQRQRVFARHAYLVASRGQLDEFSLRARKPDTLLDANRRR